MLREKRLFSFRRSIQQDFDVGVARCPRISHILSCDSLKQGIHLVAQPIERGTQRRTPLLRPSRLSTSTTTTIRPPALNAMRTTPRGVLGNFDFPSWRVEREILAIVCQPRQSTSFDFVERIR